MNIAIDCCGTLLEAGYTPRLLTVIRKALSRGDGITVWSSDSSYLDEAKKLLEENKIKVSCCNKYSKRDAKKDGRLIFDLAIDDAEDCAYLAANSFTHPNHIIMEDT